MMSWLIGAVVCLTFLVGCGGGQKGALVKMEPVPQEVTAPEENDVSESEQDEGALTEELSANRVEELYAKSGLPGSDPSLEEELKKWDHQAKSDMPIQMNKQVRAYLVYFSTERKSVIRRYLARSTRYLPMIKEVFQEHGLPEDLAYLAMIESGFNNKAYSPAAACGMWQFIKGTGLRYGLEINSYVDERRDPEKATRAAAKYLLDLYQQFGSWYLAAASYNCGEGRVQRELNQSNHKNFWELSANMCLPNETKNYVPQMIAATIIAKYPEKFGFKHVPYLPPLKVDKVKVTEPTSVRAAAVAVNVPVEEINALNPELLRGVTPPETPAYTLNLPAKSQELFTKNITIARIEHPAVASHPIRTARSSGKSYYSSKRSYSSSKKASVRSAAPRHRAVVYKSVAKKKTYAKAAKPQARTYALKSSRSKSPAPAKARSAAPVMQASMFGAPALATKQSAPRKKVALFGVAKNPPKTPAANSRKSGEAKVVRKADPASKSAVKAKKSSSASRAKGKYSRAKAKRSILVSEAR